MHTLLSLASVLLVVLVSALALGVLRRLGDRSQRREVQLLVLAAPVVSLGVGVGAVYHFARRTCFLGAPSWDAAVGVALPFGMGLVALGALGLGVVRLALMDRMVARRGVPAGPDGQALADRLADRLGTSRPRLLLCASDRPLALTFGLLRPTVLLSTWMVDHLDRRELEAVLAHELGHVVRRDYPVLWLATVLRDAFCYLPTSWAAYRQLQQEKEVACDDLAIGATQRPLALASALAKVWQQALLTRPTFGAAQPLVGAAAAIEARIARLLLAPGAPRPAADRPSARAVVLGLGVPALAGLLAAQAAAIAVMLAPMGCGPATLLGRLF